MNNQYDILSAYGHLCEFDLDHVSTGAKEMYVHDQN